MFAGLTASWNSPFTSYSVVYKFYQYVLRLLMYRYLEQVSSLHSVIVYLKTSIVVALLMSWLGPAVIELVSLVV